MYVNFSHGQFWPKVIILYCKHEAWVNPCYIPANCVRFSQRCNADIIPSACPEMLNTRSLKQSEKKVMYNKILDNDMILSK
jgi:hypothetical protein